MVFSCVAVIIMFIIFYHIAAACKISSCSKNKKRCPKLMVWSFKNIFFQSFQIRWHGSLCLILSTLYIRWLFLLRHFLQRFLQSGYLHSIFFLCVCWSGIQCFLIPDPYRKFRTFLTSTAPPLSILSMLCIFISFELFTLERMSLYHRNHWDSSTFYKSFPLYNSSSVTSPLATIFVGPVRYRFFIFLHSHSASIIS